MWVIVKERGRHERPFSLYKKEAVRLHKPLYSPL